MVLRQQQHPTIHQLLFGLGEEFGGDFTSNFSEFSYQQSRNVSLPSDCDPTSQPVRPSLLHPSIRCSAVPPKRSAFNGRQHVPTKAPAITEMSRPNYSLLPRGAIESLGRCHDKIIREKNYTFIELLPKIESSERRTPVGRIPRQEKYQYGLWGIVLRWYPEHCCCPVHRRYAGEYWRYNF